MKKFFGWLFIIIGAANFFKIILMLANAVVEAGGQSVGGVFIFALGILILGIWMVQPKKKEHKEGQHVDDDGDTD